MLVLLMGRDLGNYAVEMGSVAKFHEDWFRH
jgi:hypothetical protein